MELNYSKIFNKKTIQSVLSFCELNKIDDTDKFFKKCFQSGFNIEKYGLLGNSLNDDEKHLKTDGIDEKHTEIEVIVEKRVEVPVEVIREVEKIVEVIKEVPVEKKVYITDDSQMEKLTQEIERLQKLKEIHDLDQENSHKELFELIKKVKELEKELDKGPIEIIKEVDNNEKLKMMGETLQKLRKELSLKDKKIEELEGINKQLESIKVSQGAVYLKGSNITQKL
jgi:predicted RNase H-like nuclease (RuvC/YqgF family)